mgnify:CR=1 FL=1
MFLSTAEIILEQCQCQWWTTGSRGTARRCAQSFETLSFIVLDEQITKIYSQVLFHPYGGIISNCFIVFYSACYE